jgi:hypothetical protein
MLNLVENCMSILIQDQSRNFSEESIPIDEKKSIHRSPQIDFSLDVFKNAGRDVPISIFGPGQKVWSNLKIESDQVMANHKIDDFETNYQARTTVNPHDVKKAEDHIFKSSNSTKARNLRRISLNKFNSTRRY